MGHAGCSNMSAVPQCSGSHFGTEIFLGLLEMGMASTSTAETSRQCQSQLSCLGSSGKKINIVNISQYCKNFVHTSSNVLFWVFLVQNFYIFKTMLFS